MKLLLIQSVEALGHPGDQVNVKPGYARNYLLPQGKAVPVTKDSLRMLPRLKAKAEEEERHLVGSMKDLAAKINGVSVVIQARATDEGHLFGSVTERDVQLALAAAGWNVTVRQVRMTAHLKDAGESVVPLHLYGDIQAEIKVVVIPIDSDGQPVEVVAPVEEQPADAAAEPEPAVSDA